MQLCSHKNKHKNERTRKTRCKISQDGSVRDARAQVMFERTYTHMQIRIWVRVYVFVCVWRSTGGVISWSLPARTLAMCTKTPLSGPDVDVLYLYGRIWIALFMHDNLTRIPRWCPASLLLLSTFYLSVLLN